MTKLIAQVVNFGLVGVGCYIVRFSGDSMFGRSQDCNQTRFSGEPLFVGAGGLIVSAPPMKKSFTGGDVPFFFCEFPVNNNA